MHHLLLAVNRREYSFMGFLTHRHTGNAQPLAGVVYSSVMQPLLLGPGNPPSTQIRDMDINLLLRQDYKLVAILFCVR
jgi:hypothetical protein